MRKILLGTTGVVGAALIGMGAAQAQTAPTVRIGGYLQTTFAWADDSLDYARGLSADEKQVIARPIGQLELAHRHALSRIAVEVGVVLNHPPSRG